MAIPITRTEDVADAPGYKRAWFEDGSSQIAPAPAVDGLMGRQLQGQQVAATLDKYSQPAAQPMAAPAPMAQAPSTQPSPVVQQPQQGQPRGQPLSADPGSDLYGQLLQGQLQKDLRGTYNPGRAAFDPRAEAAARVAVPVSQTEQTSGAQYVDWGAINRANAKAREAQEIQADTGILLAKNENANARVNELESRFAAENAQAEQNKAESAFKGKWAALESEAKDYGERKVDPNRYVNSMSADRQFAFMLGAALTGYATKGAGNADYLRRFDDAIRADVAQQQEAIDRGKGRVDNALARFTKLYGGDLDAGKTALEALQYKAAGYRVQRMAAGVKTAEAESAAATMRAEFDAKVAEREAQLKSAEYGNVARSTQNAMLAPQAATAGGWSGPNYKAAMATAKEAEAYNAARLANQGKALENNTQRTTGLTPELAFKETESARSRANSLGTAEASLASLSTGIDQLKGLAGITVDESGNAKHNGIPGVGAGYKILEKTPIGLVFGESLNQLAASTLDPKGGRIRREAQELLTNKIKEASGAAFSEKEAERHAEALGSAYLAGEDQFAQAIVDFGRKIEDKRAALRAGAGPQAVQMYDQALKGEKKRTTEKSKFEPVQF